MTNEQAPRPNPPAASDFNRWARMHALSIQLPRNLPVWLSVPVWLSAFIAPTLYVLLVMIMDRLQVPAPPEGLVVSLFVLIPVLALLACGAVVWFSKMSLGWRVGGVVLTVLAMLLQCGVLLVIIVNAVSMVIAPAQ